MRHTRLLDLPPDARDDQDAPALSADQIMTAGTLALMAGGPAELLLIVLALAGMWLTGWFA